MVNLDAIAGAGPPRLEIAGRRPRSPSPKLIATAVARVAEQSGRAPEHASFFGQLIDLGFPFTLYEQGVAIAAGLPAITLTTAGDRPPPAFGDTPGRLDSARLAQMGRAAQQLARLAQPGARDRAEDDELRARGRPPRARLDDRARAGAAARARSSSRSSISTRSAAATGSTSSRRCSRSAAGLPSGCSSASFSRVFVCSAPGRPDRRSRPTRRPRRRATGRRARSPASWSWSPAGGW